jgi:hypothetical protein
LGQYGIKTKVSFLSYGLQIGLSYLNDYRIRRFGGLPETVTTYLTEKAQSYSASNCYTVIGEHVTVNELSC